MSLKMDLPAKDVLWGADPEPRTIAAYHLEAGSYRLEARLEGTAPHALPPFLDLPLDPAAIWP
jgi:hypothetical protein